MQVKQQTLVVTTGGADYLSKAGLAHRYDVTTRTVDRWKKIRNLDFRRPISSSINANIARSTP